MKYYSINEEIQKLKTNESKVYHYLYADSGFELGFGRGGVYPGHSHKFFCDILFSFKIIATSDAEGRPTTGNLIVTPPRTYMGKVITGDFLFIKFCPTAAMVVLPDKIDGVVKEGVISIFAHRALLQYPFYKNNLAEEAVFELVYREKTLDFSLGNEYSFQVFES